MAHRHHRFAVEIHHVQIFFERRVERGAELAEAAAIDEKRDLRLFFFEKRRVFFVAFGVRQVQRDRFYRKGKLAFQLFEPPFAACNDPNLVEGPVFGQRFGEFFPDAAGSACDNCNVFHKSSFLNFD